MPSYIHGEPTGKNYIFQLIPYLMHRVRNAALGLGDVDDRTCPVLVHIKPDEDPTTPADISFKFTSIYVRQIRMSRLHTAIVTNDNREGSVRLCGFGSGGRYEIY
jgi:hypothetical protein